MKKFWRISIWVLTIALVGSLLYFSRADFTEGKLRAVRLNVNKSENGGFVTKEEQLAMTLKVIDTTQNKQVSLLPLDSLYTTLMKNPWIIKTKIVLSLRRILNIDIDECNPVLRVYNKNGESLYVDNEGLIFPVSKNNSPEVFVASGDVDFPLMTEKNHHIDDSIYKNTKLREIFDISMQILHDEYGNSHIRQLFLQKNGQYRIFDKSTNKKIILGDALNVNKKIAKLKVFLSRMSGRQELEEYHTINLNYNKQVVCIK